MQNLAAQRMFDHFVDWGRAYALQWRSTLPSKQYACMQHCILPYIPSQTKSTNASRYSPPLHSCRRTCVGKVRRFALGLARETRWRKPSRDCWNLQRLHAQETYFRNGASLKLNTLKTSLLALGVLIPCRGASKWLAVAPKTLSSSSDGAGRACCVCSWAIPCNRTSCKTCMIQSIVRSLWRNRTNYRNAFDGMNIYNAQSGLRLEYLDTHVMIDFNILSLITSDNNGMTKTS